MSVNSWSHSKLMDFEKCKKYFWLKHDQRIPEPERPLPPGKTEHANDRGSRIHAECEDFVRGKGPFPKEMKHFEAELKSVQARYKAGHVMMEGEWGFDKNWQPVDWKIAWLRVKLDVSVMLTQQHALVVDYKTGKRFGNEIKHGEQTQMYALATFLKYPLVEHVTAELWYPDVNDLATLDIVRPVGMRFLKPFDKRGRKMTEATEFPPNPNAHSCKYCPYHPARGTGDCQYGV